MKSIFNLAALLAFLIPCSIMAQNAYITGQVSDAQGVLPNATLLIDGKSSNVVYTDIDGTFHIEVAPGRYKVILNEIGYNKITQTVNIKDKETVNLDLKLRLTVNQIVRSATLLEQNVEDAPATIHVISAEEIRERGYRDLQDLLEDVPEVEIQKNASTEYKDLIGFRGVSGNEKFIIFMDDIRISSAVGDLHAVAQNYSLANAQRVEVLMGPAAAIFGVDAYSGIINIITNTGAENTGIQVSGNYGNFNTTDNNVVLGFKKNDFSASVTGSYFRTDGAKYNEIYPEDYSWYNEEFSQNGTLRGSLFNQDLLTLPDADRDFRLGSSAYFINARANFKDFEIGFTHNKEVHSSALGIRDNSTTYSRDNSYGFNLTSIYAKHTFSSKNERLMLNTLFTTNFTNLDPQSSYQSIRTGYQRSYSYQNSLSSRLQERVSYEISDNVDLVAGLSFENANALPLTGDLSRPFIPKWPADLQNLNYIGSEVINSKGENLAIPQDFYHLQYFNLGTFAQALYRPAEWVQLTLGARYDYNTRYGGSINPRIGLLVKPIDNLRIKFLYGESFLSPSPAKAFSQFGSFIYDPNNTEFNENSLSGGLFSPFFLLPNPSLEAEELSSYETSVSWSMNDLLTFSVNGFYTKTTNTFFPFVSDENRSSFKNVDVAYVLTPANVGEVSYLGATAGIKGTQELNASMKLKYFAYYTFIDADSDIQAVPFVAEHTFKGGLTFKYGNLAFTPKIHYKSASSPVTENLAVLDISGTEYYQLDAYLMYDVIDNSNTRLGLFVEASNLLNEKYYNVGNNPLAGMPFIPQAPLQISFGASLKIK